MSIVKTEKLCKYYNQGTVNITALNNCSISIEKGEFIAVTGPSGSGKSTLLNICGGLDKPDSGEVYIDGVELGSRSSDELAAIRRKDIGFVFQNYQLMPIFTAYENIILPALLDQQKIDKSYIEELTEDLKISDRLYHFPSQLSGGQQQRVAIARALVNKPKLILADEPTGNLDKESASLVIDLLIASVKKYNRTLVIITHEPFIADMADRVYLVDNGFVIEKRKAKTVVQS
ncbi:MAG: ABC transporter ATP-binding protein [Clostridiales bacterium]|nr:ABC transporter ATP-binding protein [Clostridiales bacterium]